MCVKAVCRLCLSEDTNSNHVCVFNSFGKVTKLSLKDIIRTTIGLEINKEDLVSQKICVKCGKDLIKLYEFRERCLNNDRLLKNLQKKSFPRNEMHPSVTELFNTYPGIKLPNKVLGLNFSSAVEMELDGVENYFKQKNINMNKHIRQVMKSDTLKQKNDILIQGCASVQSKEMVSPISIKFKNDKSGYEIVQKSSYYKSDEGKLQNEIIDLITSSNCQTDNDRKRKISYSDKSMPQNKVSNLEMLQSGKLNSPTILSNIILKPANFSQKPVEESQISSSQCSETIPFSYAVSGISLLPCKIDELTISDPDNDLVTKIECMEDDIETVSCEFCKNCFKNEVILLAHSKMCFYKKAIENVPDVLVERVENDESLKTMYLQALDNLKKEDISPDIEISNSQFPNINYKTDTNNFIQQLLNSNNNNNQFPIEQNTQTDFEQLGLFSKPSSSKDNKTSIELKGFKSFLDLYKVPVSLKYGEKIEVNFNFQKPQESTGKFEDWSKLIPVDVDIMKKNKNIEDTFDPLKNLDLDMEMDEDTIKELLDSVNTTITKCDTSPSNNNTSIPFQTQTNDISTNINLKIPNLNSNYIPSLPPYHSIHDNNLKTYYQNNSGSANYLPPLYMDKSQNNTCFTSFDQQFQNFINVNVNVFNNKESRNKNLPPNWFTPHNLTPAMGSNQIRCPPVMQSNKVPHTFPVNHQRNTNFNFYDNERQIYINPNLQKSMPMYNNNSFQSHPYCNISNYHTNVNYASNNNNNNHDKMSYGILQNSSHNNSDSSDSNLSSIRVRPISDLK